MVGKRGCNLGENAVVGKRSNQGEFTPNNLRRSMLKLINNRGGKPSSVRTEVG